MVTRFSALALAASAVALPSAANAATTLAVETSNNLGWAASINGVEAPQPTVVEKNPAWASGSWLSTAVNGSTNVAAGTIIYLLSLKDLGFVGQSFGTLTGKIFVDNKLTKIVVNGKEAQAITADAGGVPFATGGANQFGTLQRVTFPGWDISIDLSGFGAIDSLAFVTENTSSNPSPAGINASLFAPAIPEPGTWMLMIIGLGAVGFSMRRRQATSTRFQFA